VGGGKAWGRGKKKFVMHLKTGSQRICCLKYKWKGDYMDVNPQNRRKIEKDKQTGKRSLKKKKGGELPNQTKK